MWLVRQQGHSARQQPTLDLLSRQGLQELARLFAPFDRVGPGEFEVDISAI